MSSATEAYEVEGNPSLERAKMMVKELFERHHGEVMDYADLLDALELSLPMLVEACEELEKEGKIAPVD